MFRHFLLVTFRHLARHQVYSVINVVGLAIGIAACALIYLYVTSELSYDRFHEKRDRIFEVVQQRFEPDGRVADEHTWQPYPMKGALEADIPEVESAFRTEEHSALVRRGGVTTREGMLFVDPAFFTAFSFELSAGNPETVLGDRNSLVLSETAAARLFPEGNPIGKSIEVRIRESFETLTVTGIAKDAPAASSIRYSLVAPFEKLAEQSGWIGTRETRWNASSFLTWVLLREGASRESFEARMPAFHDRYRPNMRSEMIASGEWSGAGSPAGFRLQPLVRVHLDPTIQGGPSPASDPRYSYILVAIALSLLVIACINFTTMAMGRSAGRAREVGVRKATGALRRQLVIHFWGEALLLAVLALGAGLLLASAALPVFNTLAGQALTWSGAFDLRAAVALVALVLFVSVVAGIWPAVTLARFNPAETLYHLPRIGGANLATRSLVVLQFALSVGLIAGTLVLLQQVRFLQHGNLGFDRSNVVVVDLQGLPGLRTTELLRNELGGESGIEAISATNEAFSHGYDRFGWTSEGKQFLSYVYGVETGYRDVLGLNVVKGRFFDPAHATDSTDAVVVNEAFVRMMGWEDPIGRKIPGFENEPAVIGVVADVHNLSLKEAIDAMILRMHPAGYYGTTLVRVAPGSVDTSVEAITRAWARVAPEMPIRFTFLEDDLAGQYVNERRWSRIVAWSAALAVIVACLGLFGLTALTVTRRTKEIGIRKVLGAGTVRLALLLAGEFTVLVAVASAIAIPIAWIVLGRWLEGYAYAVRLTVGVFVGAAVAALALALLTVGWHAVRAATSDPVAALRTE